MILRWAGSKRELLPLIEQLVPRHFGRYIEPFAGSAVVFFHLRPKSAIIADCNGELIRAFKAIRRAPTALYNRLIAMPRCPDLFYDLRALDPANLTSLE